MKDLKSIEGQFMEALGWEPDEVQDADGSWEPCYTHPSQKGYTHCWGIADIIQAVERQTKRVKELEQALTALRYAVIHQGSIYHNGYHNLILEITDKVFGPVEYKSKKTISESEDAAPPEAESRL